MFTSHRWHLLMEMPMGQLDGGIPKPQLQLFLITGELWTSSPEAIKPSVHRSIVYEKEQKSE